MSEVARSTVSSAIFTRNSWSSGTLAMKSEVSVRTRPESTVRIPATCTVLDSVAAPMNLDMPFTVSAGFTNPLPVTTIVEFEGCTVSTEVVTPGAFTSKVDAMDTSSPKMVLEVTLR
eukprot:TRINITY_DN1997_c0_g1::TRINITY_DN1997_c0_g1_i1::g.23155::m.23155 TRINITY_DN1997_c0_g1::TRINITY_DN1997_c0_g1_i1::g.23155  ORF type:complete len:117 (+),score=10.67,Transglut_C/PF00927.17/4.8e+02,Transglut_C/PF00927.17/0.32 TRINITY_DN1997_c0_g1_i1:120-470(+)